MTIEKKCSYNVLITDNVANTVEAACEDVEHGQIYIAGNVTITTMTKDTPTKVLGDTTNQLFSSSGLVGTDNRIQWVGSETRVFNFQVFASAHNPTDYISFKFNLYKNGTTLVTGSSVHSELLETDFFKEVSFSGLVELAKDDYLEVWVENIDNDNNATITDLGFTLLTV